MLHIVTDSIVTWLYSIEEDCSIGSKSKSMLHIVTNSIVTSSYMVIKYRGRLLYRFQIEEYATYSHLQ
ncbi:hypothetical protein QYM36_009982 [Artemia franciscana]|uniref:Uncharacterized protein n=1 Tax=Artemia franciscana TaxID=6661 RepID=A0AA88HNP0_ARTSF|nr:hypothetical protein QYM36_009982 [Artemia franciscana]